MATVRSTHAGTLHLEFDGIGENGAQAALDDGFHFVGQAAVEREGHEDLAVLDERPDAQGFGLAFGPGQRWR